MKRTVKMEVQKHEGLQGGFEDTTSELEELRWKHVCWAGMSLEPLAGREYEQAQQVQSDVKHKGRCIYFEGANTRQRLKYGKRIFQVESVFNEREENKFLVWRLIEKQNA